MTQQDIIKVIRAIAGKYGVDGDLCVAIGMVESGLLWPRQSSRFEPGYRYFFNPEQLALQTGVTVETEKREQATSWGPMHIMGGVAREFGFKGALPELFQPENGAEYAIRKVAKLVAKYEDEKAVISAYNAGTPAKNYDGSYMNQNYIDRVIERLKILRQIG